MEKDHKKTSNGESDRDRDLHRKSDKEQRVGRRRKAEEPDREREMKRGEHRLKDTQEHDLKISASHSGAGAAGISEAGSGSPSDRRGIAAMESSRNTPKMELNRGHSPATVSDVGDNTHPVPKAEGKSAEATRGDIQLSQKQKWGDAVASPGASTAVADGNGGERRKRRWEEPISTISAALSSSLPSHGDVKSMTAAAAAAAAAVGGGAAVLPTALPTSTHLPLPFPGLASMTSAGLGSLASMVPHMPAATIQGLLEGLLRTGDIAFSSESSVVLPPEIRALNERTLEKKERLKRNQEEQRKVKSVQAAAAAEAGGVSVDDLFEADLRVLRAGKQLGTASGAEGGTADGDGSGVSKGISGAAEAPARKGFSLMKQVGLAVQKKRQAKFLPAPVAVEEPAGVLERHVR